MKKPPRRKRKPYTGILVDETPWPIGRNPIGRERDVIREIGRAKLIALLDHYGIPGGLDDLGNGWKLALCLAGDHVPGFAPTYRTPPKPPHRPDDDLHVGGRNLILCLELKRAELEGRSVRQASRELAGRWRKEGKCDWNGESLRRLYISLRDSGKLTKGMIDAARVLSGGT